jgi:hypothetical protein
LIIGKKESSTISFLGYSLNGRKLRTTERSRKRELSLQNTPSKNQVKTSRVSNRFHNCSRELLFSRQNKNKFVPIV